MVDSEKMGEEERDQKIIQFFRAVFQTYDSDDAGELFPQMKSINKWLLTNPYLQTSMLIKLKRNRYNHKFHSLAHTNIG